MKNKRIIISMIVLFLSIISLVTISSADTGPKPSIQLTLLNIEGSDYYVDLLTQNENVKPDEYVDEPFVKYNEDGWIATSVRNYFLLFGDAKGNESHMHTFSYMGTPEVFKIIVQMPDDSLVISETIERKDFWARYTFDVKTGEIINNVGIIERTWYKLSDYYFYIIPVIITVLSEYIIVKIIIKRKEKIFKKLACMNIVTNTILQVLMISSFNTLNKIFPAPGIAYISLLLLAEILVFYSEYKILGKLFPEWDKKEIKKVTIVANLVSAGLTFFQITTLITMFASVFLTGIPHFLTLLSIYK